MKKYLIIIVSLVLIVTISVYVLFIKHYNVEDKMYNDELVSIDINNLSQVRKEETFTFKETLQIMKDNGYGDDFTNSFSDEYLGINGIDIGESIRFQIFNMEKFLFTEGLSEYNIVPKVWVGLEYNSGKDTPGSVQFVKPSHIEVISHDGNINGIFDGNTSTNIVNGQEFQVMVYGNIYKIDNKDIQNSLITISVSGEYLDENTDVYLGTVSFQRDFYSSDLER